MIERLKLLELLAIQKNAIRLKNRYANKRTGTSFAIKSDGYTLNISMRESDEIVDWLRQLYQFFFIGVSVVVAVKGNLYVGSFLFFFNLAFHWDFFFSAVEAYVQLKRMTSIKSHNKVYIIGHSRGGALAQWMHFFIKK